MPSKEFWEKLPRYVWEFSLYIYGAFVIAFGVFNSFSNVIYRRDGDLAAGVFFGFFSAMVFLTIIEKMRTARARKISKLVEETCKQCLESYEMHKSCVASGMYEDAEYYSRKYEGLRAEVIRLIGISTKG